MLRVKLKHSVWWSVWKYSVWPKRRYVYKKLTYIGCYLRVKCTCETYLNPKCVVCKASTFWTTFWLFNHFLPTYLGMIHTSVTHLEGHLKVMQRKKNTVPFLKSILWNTPKRMTRVFWYAFLAQLVSVCRWYWVRTITDSIIFSPAGVDVKVLRAIQKGGSLQCYLLLSFF